jgi:hypothetical protein
MYLLPEHLYTEALQSAIGKIKESHPGQMFDMDFKERQALQDMLEYDKLLVLR